MDEVKSSDIRRAAMDLLARREHSKRELRQKLLLRFSNSHLIDQEIERLCEEHLQSDSRYAEAYLYSRAQRLYGPSRIRAEMRERGIDDEIIASAFLHADIDWQANLRKLEVSKFGLKSPANLQEKARRMRFIQYRGFGGVSKTDTLT